MGNETSKSEVGQSRMESVTEDSNSSLRSLENEAKDNSTFIYQPLDNSHREIRLVRLIQLTTDIQPSPQQLQLELIHRSLDDGNDFIPLSYVWGDAGRKEDIIVNGEVLTVPKSAVELLGAIGEVTFPDTYENSGQYYWIDAVCINQGDDIEKSEQVQLMGTIYSSAQQVVSWLGHSQDAHLTAELFKTIHDVWALTVKKELGRSWLKGCDPNHNDWMHSYPHFWEENSSKSWGNSYWNAVKKFFDLPYWNRVWIFQELVLPQNLKLIYGSAEIDFNHLFAFDVWTGHFASHSDPEWESLIHATLWAALRFKKTHNSFPYAMIGYAKPRIGQLNLELVPLCKHLRATDPRDHVYGLLGLMQTCLKPDYTKTIEEVFVDLAITWITERLNCNILALTGLSLQFENQPQIRLPSWVPNWHDLSEPSLDAQSKLLFPTLNPNYKASTGVFHREPLILGSEGVCILSGLCCGEIEEVTPRWTEDYSDGLLEWIIAKISKRGTILDGPDLPLLQVLFRTMILDALPESHERLNLNGAEIHSLAMSFLVKLLPIRNDKTWDEVLMEYLPKLGLDHGSEFTLSYKRNFFPSIENIPQWPLGTSARSVISPEATLAKQLALGNGARLKDRHLFFTSTGYLGLGPVSSKGDLVVVLAGCDAPAILRRQGVDYQLVGLCFVLGLMDGEAANLMNQGKLVLEDFWIH